MTSEIIIQCSEYYAVSSRSLSISYVKIEIRLFLWIFRSCTKEYLPLYVREMAKIDVQNSVYDRHICLHFFIGIQPLGIYKVPNTKRLVYCQYGQCSLTFQKRFGFSLTRGQHTKRQTTLSQPFYISFRCISTLPTQHTRL